jgi:hypothetical protein
MIIIIHICSSMRPISKSQVYKIEILYRQLLQLADGTIE